MEVYYKKIIPISIDGMRPDGLKECGNAFLNKLTMMSSHTFNTTTVFPSITLPCHLSIKAGKRSFRGA